jgi:hypothetical protein
MSYESHKYCNGNLYVSIVMDVKKSTIIWNLYAGIIMDVKYQQLSMRPICDYCKFEMAL